MYQNHNSHRPSDGEVLACLTVGKNVHLSETRLLVAVAGLKRSKASWELEFAKLPQNSKSQGSC